MKAETILSSEDFKKCADFHGHICPGLAIGYRIAKAGLDWLEENRSVDEELVTIVETDACGVDAIQVLTGCTFGKGNLIYEDHGKQAFTFLGRKAGKGVRAALKADVIPHGKRHWELMDKARNETASEEELKEINDFRKQTIEKILSMPLEKLLKIEAVDVSLPSKARIEPSIVCDGCGEPTMSSKLVDRNGRKLCRTCYKKA